MELDKKLADIIIAIFDEAHPKYDCSHKFVPTYLLDKLSERLAELGR